MPSSSARALEQVEFGGVDSRSNPLNMPKNRALRCLNWTVKPGGYLELRPGYTTVSQSSVTASVITALIPYTLFNQTRYVIRFQGTTPYQVAIADGTVTGPTYATGVSFTSSTAGRSFFYNNRLYYGNGTDQNYFDGITWRASGLAPLTAAQALAIKSYNNIGEMSAAQEAAATLAQSAGGAFPVSTFGGMFFYCSLFVAAQNSLSPAFNPITGARIAISTLNNKVTIGSLPDTTAASAALKLISRTDDGTGTAGFVTTAAATNITSLTKVGSTVTVVATAHGRSTGDVVVIAGASDSSFNGVWSITVVDANTFTIALFYPISGTSASGGTVANILKVAAATLTVDVTTNSRDTNFQTNDTSYGIPASTIGGANPGFQFYAAIARVVNGSIVHVGNRMPIGGRLVPTVPSNVSFGGLPSFADPELRLMIGRTGDGATIPYASVDKDGNFFVVPASASLALMAPHGGIDGNNELPFRNTVIPSTCDKFALVGDFVWAADSISPTIRRSGSALLSSSGQFLGDIAQSWASNDIETFPTNDTPTLLAETDGMLFVTTRTDCAFLQDNLGTPLWIGPYTKGGAGPRAFVKTDHGFFWVSWDKELCTLVDGKPMAVSDEYNVGELSLLGDAFKTTIELQYFRSVALDRDEIIIFGKRSDGTPHQVVVDFKTSDTRSVWGQGRGQEFVGPLASFFTTAMVIDANNVRQIWGGATNGNLYQLYSGANDAGSEYSADLLALLATSLERPMLHAVDFAGDGNIQVSYSLKLNATLDVGAETDLVPLTQLDALPMQVPGRDDLAFWRLNDIPELLGHVYLRFQLTSHSADGNLNLSSPPHAPLETYGRLYLLAPMIGEERGRA